MMKCRPDYRAAFQFSTVRLIDGPGFLIHDILAISTSIRLRLDHGRLHIIRLRIASLIGLLAARPATTRGGWRWRRRRNRHNPAHIQFSRLLAAAVKALMPDFRQLAFRDFKFIPFLDKAAVRFLPEALGPHRDHLLTHHTYPAV